MPSFPIDDLLGFGAQVRAYLDNYKTQLIAKGFDPTTVIGQIDADEQDLSSENQTQESLKTQRTSQTETVVTKQQALYDKTSSTLDAAAGFLGKTTNEGKEALALRANINDRQIDDVIGFAQQFRAFLSHYSAQLTAAGFDPTTLIADLDTDADDLATQNNTQESLKTQLKNQTKVVTDKSDGLYKKISSTLDAATGLLGKTTAEGKEGLQIRANLRGGGSSPPPPPGPPPPPPGPPPPPPPPP